MSANHRRGRTSWCQPITGEDRPVYVSLSQKRLDQSVTQSANHRRGPSQSQPIVNTQTSKHANMYNNAKNRGVQLQKQLHKTLNLKPPPSIASTGGAFTFTYWSLTTWRLILTIRSPKFWALGFKCCLAICDNILNISRPH
jgi:hypothetical protein